MAIVVENKAFQPTTVSGASVSSSSSEDDGKGRKDFVAEGEGQERDTAAPAGAGPDAISWNQVLIHAFELRLGLPLDKFSYAKTDLENGIQVLHAYDKEIKLSARNHVLHLPFEKSTPLWSLSREIVRGEEPVDPSHGLGLPPQFQLQSNNKAGPPSTKQKNSTGDHLEGVTKCVGGAASCCGLLKCFKTCLLDDPRLRRCTKENTPKFVPAVKRGFVVDVYDGDTITIAARQAKSTCSAGPRLFKVRLARIDTPEMKGKDVSEKEKKLAIQARDALREKILGKFVRLENVALEKYGRLLAEVVEEKTTCFGWRRAGKNWNQWLLDEGHAKLYDGGTKDTNW